MEATLIDTIDPSILVRRTQDRNLRQSYEDILDFDVALTQEEEDFMFSWSLNSIFNFNIFIMPEKHKHKSNTKSHEAEKGTDAENSLKNKSGLMDFTPMFPSDDEFLSFRIVGDTIYLLISLQPVFSLNGRIPVVFCDYFALLQAYFYDLWLHVNISVDVPFYILQLIDVLLACPTFSFYLFCFQ